MPEAPQVREGEIIPIDANYGKTVYVTLGDQRKLQAAYGAVAILGVVFVFSALNFAKSKR